MDIWQKLKHWNSIFCSGMACKTNIKRDFYVITLAIAVAGAFLYANLRPSPKNQTMLTPIEKAFIASEATEEQKNSGVSEEDIQAETEKLAVAISTADWKPFTSSYWGFKVKYPGDWLAPKTQTRTGAAKWESRYQYRKKDAAENTYLGFDITVYDVSKIKELRDTEEYPVFLSEDIKTNVRCQNIEGHAIEIDEFPAEEIYVPGGDECFNPTLFFTIVKDQYIYNISPVLKAESESIADPRISINNNFPEYYAAASTLDLISIVRPKPAPPKPRITAPKPVSFRVVGGKLVCAKKNDKPRKSRQNKGKHLDMECCLDPDEYPNPWCTY